MTRELTQWLAELAGELRSEQHSHDEVREIWRDNLATGTPDSKHRATELLKRTKAIRLERANQLRDVATEAPQSIKANLFKLAIRLETSGDDVTDDLCELAAEAAAGGNFDPASVASNQQANENSLLAGLRDEAMMNHRHLAGVLQLESEPLRKRLNRWRKKNGDGWQELTEATSKEPRYLYRVGDVREVLREAINAK
ncbi:MAG: hypothetical protein O3C40_19565 [Planctomycetota bacterium]|nr:hypothetical protein [Planctomycetota bacterium]